MPDSAQRFRKRLANATGLTDSAINAAWPEWWSDAADSSPSAVAELRFSIARKLGLDPRSLLEDEQPRFIWDDSAKFKNFRDGTEIDRSAITSFGASVSRLLLKTIAANSPIDGIEPSDIRASILAQKPFVGLIELLAFLWGVGIPVIHLRVFPLSAKRMCAMAVRVHGRYAILLARDSHYPASVAFHLAHEIGHIALAHVAEDAAIVDMEDPETITEPPDSEEAAADRYALALLTGTPDFSIGKRGAGNSARELANQALSLGPQYGIEPGALALCYGYETKEWAVVHSALHHIYSSAIPAWSVTNKIAKAQMQWDELGDESTSFLRAIMGGI